MKTNRLQNFNRDLIKIAEHSNNSIKKDLIVLANDSSSEFSNWIKSAHVYNDLSNLNDKKVIDALRFLISVHESHPQGISAPDFVKYFFGTSNDKYLPYLIYFKNELDKGESTLRPFSNVLSEVKRFEENQAPIDPSADFNLLKSGFRAHISDTVNSIFEGGKVHKGKLNKDEKVKQLFNYLIEKASNDLSNALRELNFDSVADKISSDPMSIVDVKELVGSKLLPPNKNMKYIFPEAKELAKTILKRVEVSDNEYNYSLLINTAMNFGNFLSNEDYEKFFYDLMLSKGRDETSKIKSINFDKINWLHPTVVAYISSTLMLIMTQVKF